MTTTYFAPVRASNGHFFYLYDEVPGLVSVPRLSKRLSLAAFERVALLLNDNRPGYELIPQKWNSHLRDGHEPIELHTIRPSQEVKTQHHMLKVMKKDTWSQEWLDALQFIEEGALIHE